LGKATSTCSNGIECIVIQRPLNTQLLRFKPVVVKLDPVNPMANLTKGVDIAVALATPMIKANAELISGMGCGHKFGLINTQDFIKTTNMRNGRLAHTHRANGIGFYQSNLADSGR